MEVEYDMSNRTPFGHLRKALHDILQLPQNNHWGGPEDINNDFWGYFSSLVDQEAEA